MLARKRSGRTPPDPAIPTPFRDGLLEQFQGDWNLAELMGFTPLNPSYRVMPRLD